MTRVLLVDDEPALRVSLSYALRKTGYTVDAAADGIDALAIASTRPPDIILLDLMLPGLDGMELCRRLRVHSQVPVIMLTACGDEESKVKGLRTGADDYVTKPFSTRELIARMEAVLRRSAPAPASSMIAAAAGPAPAEPAGPPLLVPASGTVEHGPFRMDVDRHEAWVRGKPVELTPKEFHLLLVLVANAGRVLTREQLIETVWGADFMGEERTLGVHVHWLRSKVEENPSEPQHIVTLRGVGLRLD